ncbi:hypothetical protein Tco_0887077 [Tanacetum coccineum]
MDYEPMWAADRVVALTPGPTITIPKTANEFSIKENHLTFVKGNQFDGRIKTDPHKHIHEFLDPILSQPYIAIDLREIRAFSQYENETLIRCLASYGKTMLRKLSRTQSPKGNIIKIFYHGLNETTQEALNAAASGIFLYKTPNQSYQLLEDKVLLKLDWAKNQKPKAIIRKTIAFAYEGSSNSDNDKIMARMDAMTMKMYA